MYLGMYSTVGGFCLGVMEKLRVHHQQLSPSRPRAKYNYDVSSHHQSVSYSLHVVLLSPQPLTVQLRGCELAASRSRALENGGTLESLAHIPEKLLSQPFLGGGTQRRRSRQGRLACMVTCARPRARSGTIARASTSSSAAARALHIR